jgi:hypothetical protein
VSAAHHQHFDDALVLATALISIVRSSFSNVTTSVAGAPGPLAFRQIRRDQGGRD